MKYTFKSGAVVEGTMEQILAIAGGLKETVELSKIGGGIPRGYYNSEHSGLVKIVTMNNMHIRNAMLKLSKRHFEDLGKNSKCTNEAFLKTYVSLTENATIQDLFTELTKRP